MKATHRPHRLLLVLALPAILGAAAVVAAVPPDNVGQGTHFAGKPLGKGAYFDDRNRALVHRYFQAHPLKPCAPGSKPEGCLPSGPVPWAIGKPLPANAVVQPVPRAIVQDLPKLPPGNEYVQVGGDILLVARDSKMVVDGINGPAR
jgi:hypothetical protein